ncbi:MAG TPA: AAA family ATPase, partial [Anaerolineaceae bacterium]
MRLPETVIFPELVGREREMEILGGALRSARGGAGSCVLLAGEAGIGKSRLAAELSRQAASAGFWVLRGYCSEQDSAFPYAPWTDALRAFLAPRNAAETGEVLGPFAAELVKLLPELALLLPSLQPSPPLDPAAEKHRLFETLARFIASLAKGRPLLILLEDLHWSDQQSLELLRFLVRRAPAVSLLILGTYRDEDVPLHLLRSLDDLHRERKVIMLPIGPLDRPNIARLAQGILRSESQISAERLDLLVHLTGGNPFFVEEIARSLAQSSAQTAQEQPLPIPRSLQQTVQRRVDELHERTRQVLSLAAVTGERFDFDLLRSVSAEEERALVGMLKELIAAGLIVEQPADQFAFRHALTREVVYSGLLLRERKALHRIIGETVERSAEAQGDAVAALLAYHFYEAGEWQKALDYSQRAGGRAQALYAPREALAHFTRALDASWHLGVPPRLSTLRGRAQAYEILGEFDRARADDETALDLAALGADPEDQWQALLDLGFLWQSRDLDRAGEYYQRALELARSLGDPSVLARTLNRVGNWHMNRGQAHEALPYHREALVIFRERDDRRGIAQTMDLLGIVSYQLGEVVQGAAYLEQALPILRGLDDRQGLVNTLVNLTMRAVTDTEILGETSYPRLAELSDEALQIAQGFHWYHGELIALMQGAISLGKAGESGRALDRLARARSMAEENHDRESFARLHLIFGQVYTGLFALKEAQQHLETGLASLQELGSGLLVFSAKTHLAGTAVLQGDLTRAEGLLNGMLPPGSAESEDRLPLRRCWSVRAELELAQDHPHRALEIVERLIAATPGISREGPHAVPLLSRLRGLALAALGRLDEADDELRGALPGAQNLGQAPMLWQLHADLGRIYRAMGRRAGAGREFSAARA